MKREEKSGEETAEKEEILEEKLKESKRALVGKRRVVGPKPCTTPTVSWAHQAPSPAQDSTASARKLAATLWDNTHFLPQSKMYRGDFGSNAPPPPPPLALRRHRRAHDQHHRRDREYDLPTILADAYPSSSELPSTAGSLRRHVAASLMQHNRSIKRNSRAFRPVSPTSYASSLEVAPYNPAVTPSSSVDYKGRALDSGYNLKTSAELLNVLNRIWSLEEQHVSNISLVKALKSELDHARLRIKELLRDQQADRHAIDDLMKQMADDKLIRKSKEMDRLSAAVQSVRDELEDERKLRRRSESLHRKLARELSDLKSSFSNALKELETERKSRTLLEDLCDEFAGGIRDYEQELHAIKQKSDNDWAGKADHDRLVLHISESWLDERLQMRLAENQHGLPDCSSVVNKLRNDIETFLRTKQMGASKSYDHLLPPAYLKQRSLRRSSLESIPLNEAVSAPQDAGDEEDSVDNDLHCFELNKPSNGNFEPVTDEGIEIHSEMVKSNHTKKKLTSHDNSRGRFHPSILQVKFEEQMARGVSDNYNKTPGLGSQRGNEGDGNPSEAFISQESENCEATEEVGHEGTDYLSEIHQLDKVHEIGNTIRSQVLAETESVHPESNYGGASNGKFSWRNHAGHASPVRKWMSNLTPQDPDVSVSLKPSQTIKEKTSLKTKLLEARSKLPRTRLKASKGSG